MDQPAWKPADCHAVPEKIPCAIYDSRDRKTFSSLKKQQQRTGQQADIESVSTRKWYFSGMLFSMALLCVIVTQSGKEGRLDIINVYKMMMAFRYWHPPIRAEPDEPYCMQGIFAVSYALSNQALRLCQNFDPFLSGISQDF